MTTSKSPRRVFLVAYEAAREALPAYSPLFSPKKYTQHPFVACLVLKEFLRTGYRGLADPLANHPELARQIDLQEIPRFTTFQKAAGRLLRATPARELFDAMLAQAPRKKVRKRRVPLAAVDGTSLERRHVSRYYVKRRSKTGTATRETTDSKYPKAVLVVDCTSHLILAAAPDRTWSGSRPCCVRRPAGRGSGRCWPMRTSMASGSTNEFGRGFGIRTVISPTRGRPSEKPPAGKWRRRMKQRFAKKKYGQRWRVETVNGMIKRRLGPAPRARSYWSQCREIILRVITHNAMVVIRVGVFYGASLITFPLLGSYLTS